MDAPPTPPPMTTARACFLKRSLGACLRRRDAGVEGSPLRDRPVDETHDQDHRERGLEQGDASDRPEVGKVRQAAHRRVLVADPEGSRPEEIDFPCDTPNQAQEGYPEAPPAQPGSGRGPPSNPP